MGRLSISAVLRPRSGSAVSALGGVPKFGAIMSGAINDVVRGCTTIRCSKRKVGISSRDLPALGDRVERTYEVLSVGRVPGYSVG